MPDAASEGDVSRSAILQGLQDTLGDDSLVQEVIALFLERIRHQWSAVTTAAAARDARSLETAAHLFKGTCLTLGVARAVNLALAVESLAKVGSVDQVATVIPQLGQTLEAMRAALGGSTEGKP